MDLKVQQQQLVQAKHMEVFQEHEIHLEALKKSVQIEEMHLQAFLPFQIASICFEITSDLAKKKGRIQYRKNFRNILTELEQNLLSSCEPDKFISFQSEFRPL